MSNQSHTLPSSSNIFQCLSPKTRYSRVAPYFKLVEVFLQKNDSCCSENPYLTVNQISLLPDSFLSNVPQKPDYYRITSEKLEGIYRSREPTDPTKAWVLQTMIQLW